MSLDPSASLSQISTPNHSPIVPLSSFTGAVPEDHRASPQPTHPAPPSMPVVAEGEQAQTSLSTQFSTLSAEGVAEGGAKVLLVVGAVVTWPAELDTTTGLASCLTCSFMLFMRLAPLDAPDPWGSEGLLILAVWAGSIA